MCVGLIHVRLLGRIRDDAFARACSPIATAGRSLGKSRRVGPLSGVGERGPLGLAALTLSHPESAPPLPPANARTLLSPTTIAMPSTTAPIAGVLQGIANVEEKKSLIADKAALEKVHNPLSPDCLCTHGNCVVTAASVPSSENRYTDGGTGGCEGVQSAN